MNIPRLPKSRLLLLKIMAALLLVAAIIIGLYYFNLNAAMLNLLHWIDDLGLDPWVIILIYTIIVPLMLPGLMFTLGAGFLLGILKGSLCVLIGTGLGSAVAFLAARYAFRGGVAQKLKGHPMFMDVDAAMADEGWKIGPLTRMVPFFPFKLSNYFFGVTGIRFWPFFWASLIGNVPLTLVNTYVGSLAGDLSTLNTRFHRRTPLVWAAYGFGLCALIALSIYLMRLARKILHKKIYT